MLPQAVYTHTAYIYPLYIGICVRKSSHTRNINIINNGSIPLWIRHGQLLAKAKEVAEREERGEGREKMMERQKPKYLKDHCDRFLFPFGPIYNTINYYRHFVFYSRTIIISVIILCIYTYIIHVHYVAIRALIRDINFLLSCFSFLKIKYIN